MQYKNKLTSWLNKKHIYYFKWFNGYFLLYHDEISYYNWQVKNLSGSWFGIICLYTCWQLAVYRAVHVNVFIHNAVKRTCAASVKAFH